MWRLAYHADKLWVVSVVTHGSTQVVGEHFAVDIDPRAPGIIISPLLQRPCTPSAHGAPLGRAHAWDRQTDWGRDASWLFRLIRRWLGVVHFFFKSVCFPFPLLEQQLTFFFENQINFQKKISRYQVSFFFANQVSMLIFFSLMCLFFFKFFYR